MQHPSPSLRSAERARAANHGPLSEIDSALAVRSLDTSGDPSLERWIHERLGRQLGKYATRIERVDVRFEDLNGPRGGIDRCCMVHVVLHGLPPVVVEMRGTTNREAFDLATSRAERATKRSLQKHGITTKHRRRDREHDSQFGQAPSADGGQHPARAEAPSHRAAARAHSKELRADILYEASSDEPEEHTAYRHARENTAGMPYALEDSLGGKPTRKSTRGGANHIKPGNPQTLRTKAALHSPQQVGRRH